MQKEYIRYFKECYQADNREHSLWTIFAKKAQMPHLIDSAGCATFYEKQSLELPTEYASALDTLIKKYRREKVFLFCSHFLIGRIQENAYGKLTSRKICSPLLMSESECVTEKSNAYINTQIDARALNYTLINQLVKDWQQLENIQELLENASQFPNPQQVVDILNEHIEGFECHLSNTPVSDLQELKSLASQKVTSKQLLLVPCAVSLLLDRSIASRGIIDELEVMHQQNKPSRVLTSLNSESASNQAVSAAPADCENVPGLLSSAQQSIIEKTSQNTLSLLIGPPGTGKSYTIASLALERFMAGESVLVVSENEHSVDVIREKLIHHFGLAGDAVMRAGTKDYHRQLKKYLDRITKGGSIEPPGNSNRWPLFKLSREIKAKEAKFLKLLKRSESYGAMLLAWQAGEVSNNFLNRIRLWQINRHINNNDLLQKSLKEIQQLNKKREALLAQQINYVFLNKLNKTLRKNRQQLVQLRQAFGARTSQRQEKLFGQLDFSVLLDTMPIWLCSLDALHKALPLQKEMFDLVIVDEATQCDIASCLPALQRAERALIVGDPKQLRHVSFLSRSRQQQLLEKCGIGDSQLSYRDHSMVDIADQNIVSQEAVVFLDEHYRSLPKIIQFSNQHFYDSQLKIMREKPLLQGNRHELTIVPIENGKRVKGINSIEADAIFSKLRQILDDLKNVPAEFKLSIGILSFFRAQSEYLQDRLFEEFSLDDITIYQIRAGTPYTFQGEERDIMLISCCVDQTSTASTYTYLNRADVFNVAITRAKEQQYLFSSVNIKDIPSNNYLKKYFAYCHSYQQNFTPKAPQQISQVQEFIQHFEQRDFRVLTNYTIASVTMDIVLIKDNETIAVDLVGFPGGQGQAFQLERYKLFERAGLTIIPVFYGNWINNQQKITQTVENLLLQLIERNKAKRLSSSNFDQHWNKLLQYNVPLAHSARKMEADLLNRNNEPLLNQLEQLIECYCKVIWILKEKLSPSELTFIRYQSSSEQLLANSLDNLSQIITAQKVTTDVDSVNHQLFLDNKQAISSLEQLAIRWSKVKNQERDSSIDMKDAILDMENLIEKVDKYE